MGNAKQRVVVVTGGAAVVSVGGSARARTIAGRPATSPGTASSSTVNLASSIVIAMRRTIVAVNDDRPPSGSAGSS